MKSVVGLWTRGDERRALSRDTNKTVYRMRFFFCSRICSDFISTRIYIIGSKSKPITTHKPNARMFPD